MAHLKKTGMKRGKARRMAQSFSKRMTHLLTHSLEDPGGGGSVVDTTAVHVNLLPFRTSLSLYDLYHSLQSLFTLSMTAAEQKESAASSPLGPIPNTKPCKIIRPSIGLFPESDKAVVEFGEGECGKIAATTFLRTQIEKEVRQFIREEVFEVNAEECAPFATETYGAIELAIEQILLSNIPMSELKEAIKHATNELTDRYQFALDANRALVLSTPSVKVESVRTLRLLQALAMTFEHQSIFTSLISTTLARQFGVSVKLDSRILEMVDQMFTEYSATKIFCEACVIRHMLHLVLSVGISNGEEGRQFLFRLLARIYTTAILDHIKILAALKERVLHNYTYWNEYKLFTRGLRIFDPTSLAIVKFFYYLDEAQLQETLSDLFDDALRGLGDSLRNSRESEPSSSPVVLRIHHFVARKLAYAAEIATARGSPPPPPLEEREVYEQLFQAYEDVKTELSELKPLIINVLKSGQYYPGGYLCMDNSTPAMWVFSTGVASNVAEVLDTLQ
ncbi:hypothetical protein ACSSS7_001454 [Eimeria intestinalis]